MGTKSMEKENQMTIEEALALIPTHILLRPEKDRWQAGDEVVVIGMSVVGLLSKVHSQEWEPCDERDIGRLLLEKHIGRRPISESVRKDMALDLKLSVEESTTSEFQEWLLSTQGESK